MRTVVQLPVPYAMAKRLNSSQRLAYGSNRYFRFDNGLASFEWRGNPHGERNCCAP